MEQKTYPHDEINPEITDNTEKTNQTNNEITKKHGANIIHAMENKRLTQTQYYTIKYAIQTG